MGDPTMRAAILQDYGRIENCEVDIPKAPHGEIILKVTGCGVCGTDVHIAAGDVSLAKPPVVLGHEIAAEVHDISGADCKFEIGEPVIVDPVIGCGKCRWCRVGKTNLCSSQTIIGYVRPGGFCQYISVPLEKVYSVPEKLGPKGGILVETLACVVNGYERLNPRPGNMVLILGAGSVGLLWLELIKHSLATYVAQTDLVESRAATAGELGANLAMHLNSKCLGGSLDEAGIKEFDIIVDATGDPVAVTEALPYLGKGGKFMFFGVCPEGESVEISPYEMFLKEQTLIGAKMPPSTFDQSISLIESGVINTEALVNRVLPLSRTGEAIKMFNTEKDKSIKMMIDPWLEE
jgi:2-desacetyl-2-hydroxyethyl bacteriochlorophyllide A dehydrogenase